MKRKIAKTVPASVKDSGTVKLGDLLVQFARRKKLGNLSPAFAAR